jgi:hypothetical protein
MISRLFDAGLQLGTDYGTQKLGIMTGVNQATRLGVSTPQLTATTGNNSTQQPAAGLDPKMLMIGAGLLVLVLLLAKH